METEKETLLIVFIGRSMRSILLNDESHGVMFMHSGAFESIPNKHYAFNTPLYRISQ